MNNSRYLVDPDAGRPPNIHGGWSQHPSQLEKKFETLNEQGKRDTMPGYEARMRGHTDPSMGGYSRGLEKSPSMEDINRRR